ncbi:MAG: CPBP family intramembrane glutamic endopeptidase [Ilumatobacteraceae bacterium]|nr:MAG: CPBP family intramembrane metalloprotease [Actinomycetota bacterium]
MRPATNQTRFTVGAAAFAWLACYVVALPAQAVVIALSGYGDADPDSWPIWVTVASVACLWVPFLVALVVMSQRFGTARFADDYRLRMRPADLAGVPIGVLSQLALVPLVYWPLESWFPDTFSSEKVEERARELWDRADGVWLVVLVLMVALGAPIIEELVYRGMILQALQARVLDVVAVVIGAAWFAAIHLRPVELPGLFAFAVVLGLCFQRTGRLAMPILAHIAFNVVGLAITAA